jgi:hypothetical protein
MTAPAATTSRRLGADIEKLSSYTDQYAPVI